LIDSPPRWWCWCTGVKVKAASTRNLSKEMRWRGRRPLARTRHCAATWLRLLRIEAPSPLGKAANYCQVLGWKPRGILLFLVPRFYTCILFSPTSPFALIRSHCLEIMQGIFLSFYFLRILIFLSLQSKYAVAAVRGNYSNLDIFHCLPVPSASRESRLEGREAYICKSTGVHAKVVQTRTLWKKGREWNTVWPWASIPVNSNSTSPNASSCKIGSFASSLPQPVFAVFKFRKSPNWRLFFFLCVSLVFFLPRNWRINCATTEMHGMNRIWQWSWRQMAASQGGYQEMATRGCDKKERKM